MTARYAYVAHCLLNANVKVGGLENLADQATELLQGGYIVALAARADDPHAGSRPCRP